MLGWKTADAVGAALVRTITADSSKEFAGRSLAAEALRAEFFFAASYHSRERGLNEHVNGLVRECLPRDTDFGKVTDAFPDRVPGLASSGERGYAAFRRDFSRLGPGFRVSRGLDSPSQGHLRHQSCALAAEMAGVALRSGSGERCKWLCFKVFFVV